MKVALIFTLIWGYSILVAAREVAARRHKPKLTTWQLKEMLK
jgi:hypothetical protein